MPYHVAALLLLLLGAASASEEACTCGNGRAKLWGPGGPHTALVPAAELWNLQNPSQLPVEVCFGPEPTWRERALECAAGFFAGAEQQLSGFLRVFASRVEGKPVAPITMHAASLIVPSGNPLNLSSLRQVIDDDGLRIVVNDGNFRDSLTSSTALWEDVVGRTGSIQDTELLREKIVRFTANSGEARDMILNGEADVWFSWHDWWVANQQGFATVPIEREFGIARDLAVVPAKSTVAGEEVAVSLFIAHLRESPEANVLMELAGWFKEDVFERSSQAAKMRIAD